MKNTSKVFRSFLFIIFFIVTQCMLVAKEKNETFEDIGRGFVAIRVSPDSVLLSWRYLTTDAIGIAFNVYRDGVLLTDEPISTSTQYIDVLPHDKMAHYELYPVKGKKELRKQSTQYVLSANTPLGYIQIPLKQPVPQQMPDGTWCRYIANDLSVADVDGDGEFEYILKWDPTNSKDNSHSGYTGTVLIDAYRLDGSHIWRIDLGRNIRAGAHYTQFMVYDLDGDGKAELITKTADGTIDGAGNVIGNPNADYRVSPEQTNGGRFGYIASGPEYLTVFNGETGVAMCTVDYLPQRGELKRWGDNYANRSERYLAAIAYLGGKHPSVIMCRGYYTRSVLAAFDWDGKKLKSRWIFDTESLEWKDYAGQGNHNLRVADVDGDGYDEITYGACAIDHDGKGMYNTRFGHGDAMHLTAFFPDTEALQVWCCHENKRDGSELRDAATGKVIFQIPSNIDVGRCMAADIDPNNEGLEMWSSASGGIRNVVGAVISESPQKLPINMAVWWDGDLLREMLDKECISKYDWDKQKCVSLLKFEGCRFNNGTKSNPCLQGDVLGDWREEVIVRTASSDALRIYLSPCPTKYRFHTFLQDRPYRLGLAMQNVAYNQPAHPGFYFGVELEKKGNVFRGYEFKK